MKRTLAFLALSAIALFTFAPAAHAAPIDYGPPPQAPALAADCSTVSIDPPATASFVVDTLHGTVDGKPFTRQVGYGAVTPHLAVFGVSDLFAATGRIDYTMYGTWNIGSGRSAVAAGTITCHQAPATTTTTSGPTTTTTEPATTTTTAAPTTTTTGPPLPRTGSSGTGGLLAVAGVLVVGGLALAGLKR